MLCTRGAAGRTKWRGLSFPRLLEYGLYEMFKDHFQSDGAHICPTQSNFHAEQESPEWQLPSSQIHQDIVCRPPLQVLLLTFCWWGLTQRKLILSGLRHSQCEEKATENKVCRTVWSRYAHLKIWRRPLWAQWKSSCCPADRWLLESLLSQPAQLKFLLSLGANSLQLPSALKPFQMGFKAIYSVEGKVLLRSKFKK